MSTSAIDFSSSSLEPRIQIEERKKRVIENYPPDITEQLKRAAFSETSPNTFVKYQKPLNGDDQPQVAKVELIDEQLIISARDIVGVINLTPNSKLQINPKIGWGEIIEIFLTVLESERSVEYQGIPIRDFLADDLSIEDIFIIVAVNYMNSLEPIFRRGFLRNLRTQRIDALDARGNIDIERTIINRISATGVPKQHFVQKVVEHDVPINALLYKAGTELRRLFQVYSNPHDHPGYFSIFSRLDDTLRRFKARGITGNNLTLSDILEISVSDLPRQRHYYSEAISISKTVLSSSIGEPLDDGREELTMDYILSMQSLFERFVHIVIDRQIDAIHSDPFCGSLEGVTVEKESNSLFESNTQFTNQPDHVLRQDDVPIAVADTKYYTKDHNPLNDTYARSRLLSYAFQLQVESVAFVCPEGDSSTDSFAHRPGRFDIVTVNDFTVHEFERAIREYIESVFEVQVEHSFDEDLTSRQICLPNVVVRSANDIIEEDRLRVDSIRKSSREIVEHISRNISDEVLWRNDVRKALPQVSKLRGYIEENTQRDHDFAVPVFIPAGEEYPVPRADNDSRGENASNERLILHCISINNNDCVHLWDVTEPFVFDW